MKNKIYKVGGLFSGVGGIERGFSIKNKFEIAWATDLDKYSAKTYRKNYEHKFIEEDINNLEGKNLEAVDVLVGGFPCQAFSNAGRREGFMDTRGTLFFEIQRIMANKLPNAFILENVKTLKNHKGPDGLRTFEVMKNILEGKTTPNKAEIERYLGTGEALKTFRKKL